MISSFLLITESTSIVTFPLPFDQNFDLQGHFGFPYFPKVKPSHFYKDAYKST